MLFIDLGVLAGTYLGVRLFKKYKEKNTKPKTDAPKNKEKEDYYSSNRTIDQIKKRYLPISAINIVLSYLRRYNPIVYPFQMAATIYSIIMPLEKAEHAIFKEKKARSHILASAVMVMCMATNQYFAMSIGITLYFITELFIEKTRVGVKKNLTGIFDDLPAKVWILKEKIEIEVPLKSVAKDDIVVVNTGEIVPIDGQIKEGHAMIDEHILTGESQPAEKTAGDHVFASTIIIAGKITIQVSKTGKETTAAQIDQILTKAADFKGTLQLNGEKWADKAVIPYLWMGALFLPFFGALRTTALLGTNFGSGIKMFAPIGTLNHISMASKKAIFVKDGRALEKMVEVDTFLFDKTGTLTENKLETTQIFLFNGYDENHIICMAATAEMKMSHPIALAIVEKAKELKIELPDIENSQYKLGYGISVKIGSDIVRVGSLRFIKKEGVADDNKVKEIVADSQKKGNTVVIVSINDEIAGAIEMRPRIRKEIPKVIADLRKHGIKHLSIVSGDHTRPVKQLAEALGMDSYFAEVLPENKAQIVESLQKEGKKVCFIGDGINDTIAMQKADVSISLRGASSIANDMAEIILKDGSLSGLPDIIDISKSLKRNSLNTLRLVIGSSATTLLGVFFLNFNIMSVFIVGTGFTFACLGNTMLPMIKESRNKTNTTDTIIT